MNNDNSFLVDLDDNVTENIRGGNCIPVNKGTNTAFQNSAALQPSICIKLVDGVVQFFNTYTPNTP